MSVKVEVDDDHDGGLKDAAAILDELRGNFEAIADRAKAIMGHMTKACGDDHFGHKFTDGDEGFRKRCDSAVKNSGALAESFRNYSEGVGGPTGAKALMSGTEDVSAENIRRAV